MENKDAVQTAAEELKVIAPSGEAEAIPASIEDVIAGLRGFGIEELEEIITVKSKGRQMRLKISNIPTSDEMLSIQAADDLKGYLWIKRVKAEILSRSISWIDGIDIRNLPADKRFVIDPTDTQKPIRDIQVAFRNLILGWGDQVMELLWKIVMTHAQNIEDRYKSDFPEMVMTEIEKRLFDNAMKQIDVANQAIINESVAELYDDAAGSQPEAAEKK